jgi:hypothetical protein
LTTLEGWLSKVKAANNSLEIFQLLNEFRQSEWTDEECALMSKTYMAVLSKFDTLDFGTSEKKELAPVGASTKVNTDHSPNTAATGNEELEEIPIEEEEVWYEKM